MDIKRLHRDLSEALDRLAAEADPFPEVKRKRRQPAPKPTPDLSGLHARKISIDDEQEDR